MGAAVLLISRNGEQIRSQEIDGEVLLGRGEGCVIRLDDRAVSRQHAVFKVVSDGVQIEKKSEFAPVIVNGAECANSAVVKEGDVISIGPYLMRVQLRAAGGGAHAVTPQAPAPEPVLPENSTDSISEDTSVSEGDVLPHPTEAFPVGVEAVEESSDVSQNGDVDFPPVSDTPDSPSGEFLADDGDGKTRVGTVPKIFAQLQVVGGVASPEEVALSKPEIIIGRGQACDLVLSDKKSSRKHAVIRQSGIHYVIKDLDSANGTLVNGEPIREHELSSDDIIKIGDVEIRFLAINREYEEQKKDFIDVPNDDGDLSAQMGEMGLGEFPALEASASGQVAEMGAPVVAHSSLPGLGAPPVEGMTGGVSGIAGIGASASGKKQSLMQKFRALPPKKQAIYGAAAVALLWFLFEDDPEPPKKQVTKKAVVNKDGMPGAQASGGPPLDPDTKKRIDFQKLSADQKKFIEAQYALAFDFYRNKEYDKTLFELEKIFVLVQDYERAREIESYAKEGKRKMEALLDEKRRKEEEEKLKRKVMDYERELQGLISAKEYEKSKEIIVDLLTLDPENKIVTQAKKAIEAHEDQKRLEEQQKQVQMEINGRASEMVKQGREYQKSGRCYDAMDAVAKVSEIGASDPTPIQDAKKLIDECRSSIRRKREPLLAKAKESENAQDYRKAFELYQKATRVDPRHPAGYAGMNRIRDTLHQMAKVVYTEAVLAESYSDFKIAQQKFKECMAIAPEDDIYYIRSKNRMVKYIRHEKRVPAAKGGAEP